MDLKLISENIAVNDENNFSINVSIFVDLNDIDSYSGWCVHESSAIIFDSHGRAFKSIPKHCIYANMLNVSTPIDISKYSIKYSWNTVDNEREAMITITIPEGNTVRLFEVPTNDELHLLKVRKQLQEFTQLEQELTRLYPRKPY